MLKFKYCEKATIIVCGAESRQMLALWPGESMAFTEFKTNLPDFAFF